MICEPKEMIKVNLVRGVAQKIFYAKRVGQSDKIYMVKHGNQKGEIENEEIFQLTSGKLISFAVDAYNLRLMRAKKAYQLKHQSFFVLTDQQTVIQVYSNDEIKFRQLNTYDIGNYNLNVELQKINDQAFQTIAFSKDSVTLPNMFTYTLSTELRTELKIAKKQWYEDVNMEGTGPDLKLIPAVSLNAFLSVSNFGTD